jgi:putative CocE/NonD family hydrolase
MAGDLAGAAEVQRPWLEQWLAHQRRDAYWKHGSVCQDYGAIDCAVYAIGGWEDSYSMPCRGSGRAGLPRKGLIGPWTHAYPHLSEPGPAIGYLQEAVRWWDHWLKGIDSGIMDEPMYRVWMLEPKAPKPWYPCHPGRWVAEDVWPSPRIQAQDLHLGPTGLTAAALLADRFPDPFAADHRWRQRRWGSMARSPDLPSISGSRMRASLCFDTPPLAADIEILGAPELRLRLSADRWAHLAARLCDVAPDGTSALITYAAAQSHHRDSQSIRRAGAGPLLRDHAEAERHRAPHPQGTSSPHRVWRRPIGPSSGRRRRLRPSPSPRTGAD